MKKTAFILIPILLTVLLAFSSGQNPTVASLVPESAKWVIHFDMNLFSQSRLYNRILNDSRLSRLKNRNDKFAEKYGVDVLEDLDSLTLFNVGQDEEEAVICIQGEIDMKHLLGLLDEAESHKEIRYGDFTIHQWDREEHGVFVGDRLVLLSENLEGLKLALDVYSGRASGISGSWGALDDMPGNTFLSGAVRHLSDIIEDDHGPIVLKNMEQAYFFLLEEANGMALQASITAGSDDEAQKLEDVVRGLLALVRLQADSREQDFKIPDDISVARNGKNLELRLVYPAEDMLKMLSKGLGLRTSDLFELDFF